MWRALVLLRRIIFFNNSVRKKQVSSEKKKYSVGETLISLQNYHHFLEKNIFSSAKKAISLTENFLYSALRTEIHLKRKINLWKNLIRFSTVLPPKLLHKNCFNLVKTVNDVLPIFKRIVQLCGNFKTTRIYRNIHLCVVWQSRLFLLHYIQSYIRLSCLGTHTHTHTYIYYY